jgi:hypothetical protein
MEFPMFRTLLLIALLASRLPGNTYAEEPATLLDGNRLNQTACWSPGVTFSPENLRFIDGLIVGQDALDSHGFTSDRCGLERFRGAGTGLSELAGQVDYVAYVMQGQSPGNGNGRSAKDPHDSPTGGGTGMHLSHPADAHKTNKQAHPSSGGVDPTDPTAILTQIQIQNIFSAESYNASGYANTFIVQPVLPFPIAMPGLKELFPAHIVRPTLPFPAPTADPDGPLGVQGGMGDFTILDVGIHPTSWGNLALGYSLIAPTSTHPQLGLQEWQLGPTVGVIYKKIPKTIVGFVAQMPFSMESEASSVDVQLTYVRHLPNQTYIRWGDTFWTFNTKTGAYNMPIQVAYGKVFKKGIFGLPNNIFVMPFYTPEGMHSGPGGDKWGVKLSVTLLFPDVKFGPLL